LLRNGRVIEGRIEKLGDYYQVSQSDGQIRVRSGDVQFVCRDVEEGYRRKQALIHPQDINEHLELAQWCQRQGLLSSAANELSAAMEIDPSHPMIDVLRRRLKMAMEAPSEPPPPRPAMSGPSNEELDRMVRGMPAGTVESFIQSIQPVLMNHCMTSGCHSGPSDHRLAWIRAPQGQPPSRRVTQRNLYAALQWIDWNTPGDSPLLKSPRGPHGTVPTAIFTDRQLGQYRRLSEWVYRVAQRPMPAEGASGLGGIVSAPATCGFGDLVPPRNLPARPGRSLPMPPAHRPGGGNPVQQASGTVPVGPRNPDAFDQAFPADAETAPPTVPTPAARALEKP
jgi:hypothetical protein